MMGNLSRRALFAGFPVAAAALLPGPAVAGNSAVLATLHELESHQGWQMAGIACANAYAAYRMRQALGLALPDPERALDHMHMRRAAWDAYTRSVWYERDLREGKGYTPPATQL